MDTCSILLFALLHSKQVMDKITLTRCKKLQQFICDSRCAPQIAQRNHVAHRMIAKGIDGELRSLGIFADILCEERINLDTATHADCLLIALSAFIAIQSHVVSLLRTEAAFRTTCAAALRETRTSVQMTALSPATPGKVHAYIILERNRTVTRLPLHLATPVGLMFRRGWMQWRLHIQRELEERYPMARVSVYMQPFGKRMFRHGNPAGRRDVIVIWDPLEIVAYVTYPFNVFGIK